MANLTSAVPVEPDKTEYLHDRSNRPKAPAGVAQANRFVEYLPLLLIVALGAGAQALSFTTRASWDGHRDWVVPTTTPIWVAGAVALGAVLWRQKWQYIGPALGFLGVGLVLTILNIVRGMSVDGSDTLRNVLTILAAIMYGCATVAAIAGWVTAEVKDPIQAPAPEV